MGKGNLGQDSFYSSLEVGRGVAAFMVALFHVGLSSYFDPFGLPHRLIASPRSSEFTWMDQVFRILGNGPGAVVFFFVLSGFVLTKVLCKNSDGYSFLVSRVFRIYPSVVVTIFIFGAIFIPTGIHTSSPEEYTPSNLALNALLFRVGMVGVTWSLQVEMIAAPMLLILFALWKRHGPQALYVPFAVLVGLSFIGSWNRLLGEQGGFGQIYAFIAGMAAFLYGEPIVKRLRHQVLSLSLSITAFAISRAVIGWSSSWTLIAETLSCAAIISILAFGPYKPANSPAFRVARFFGRISFSFYLLHPLFLLFSFNMTDQITLMVRDSNPFAVNAALFLCSIALITPIAWLQYRLVERYGVSIGANLIRAFRPTKLAPADN
jgi:peptidoglycan/LPS O-acetylase OafA/YrhL